MRLHDEIERIADNFADEYFGLHHQKEYRQYLSVIISKVLDVAIATINNVGLDAADEKATQTAIQALKVNKDES